MKYLPVVFFFFLTTLHAQEQAQPQVVPLSSTKSKTQSVMMIDAKKRGSDLVEAFDLIKKDKPAANISLQLTQGSIPNIISIKPLENGTVIYVKTTSSRGNQFHFVFAEDIVSMKAQ